jgi:hypothetical protein
MAETSPVRDSKSPPGGRIWKIARLVASTQVASRAIVQLAAQGKTSVPCGIAAPHFTSDFLGTPRCISQQVSKSIWLGNLP